MQIKAFAFQDSGQASFSSPLWGGDTPLFSLPCSWLSFSQGLLCWICFSKFDCSLISTSELSASIPYCQPHHHRPGCEKEFRFLNSSTLVGGVGRDFPALCQSQTTLGLGQQEQRGSQVSKHPTMLCLALGGRATQRLPLMLTLPSDWVQHEEPGGTDRDIMHM